MLVKKTAVLCALFLVLNVTGTAVEPALGVNIFQLLSTPEKYDGKTIRVIGYLTLGHESDFLFPYETDAIHLINMNQVLIDATPDMRKSQAKLSRKYVIIVGTFKAASRDQHGIGSITNIRSCDVWSDPDNPLSVKLQKLRGAGGDSHGPAPPSSR